MPPIRVRALVPLFALLGGPVAAQAPLAELPDPCALLSRADAAELLGEPVDPGRSYPTSPWNCVYRTRGSDGLLTLTLELGQGTEIASTRSGVELTACGARVEREVDGLGEGAALYHTPEGRCGEAWTLWVATGVRFRGRTSSGLAHDTEGVFHLTVVRYPPGDRDATALLLRAAAERALERLAGSGRRRLGISSRPGVPTPRSRAPGCTHRSPSCRRCRRAG